MTLQVLGRASSINVRKVLWCCVELGLEPDVDPWGGDARSLRSPEFLALNPNAMVPVIRDGDFVLWESNTICRYLATKHRRDDLLPEAPEARARVEQWMDWQATTLNAAWRYAFMARVRQSPAYADAAQTDASVAAWNDCMTLLDAQLQRTSAYAAGPCFTLADIVLGLSTHRWLSTPMTRPSLAAVDAYVARLAERPGFANHGPGAGP